MTAYATLLRDHVTLTCRSIDRIFLQAYVPKLQTVGWVCQILRWQRGFPIPSSAAFGKIGAYAPYPIWLWLNGHEWAKRQCEKAGIGCTALDNGFGDCENPGALQRLCDRLAAVKSFCWRWQRRLPSPLTTADMRQGYTYELAFRQFEVSDTRVFDRPAAGRAFFEQVIRDHLDIGRPSQVALIFDRRITSRRPGRMLTGLMDNLLDTTSTARQATYDLRRLRRKGIIERIEHSHRYRLPPRGRAVAVLFTKTYGRVLGPGLAASSTRVDRRLNLEVDLCGTSFRPSEARQAENRPRDGGLSPRAALPRRTPTRRFI